MSLYENSQEKELPEPTLALQNKEDAFLREEEGAVFTGEENTCF